jgi:hypothetical protein
VGFFFLTGLGGLEPGIDFFTLIAQQRNLIVNFLPAPYSRMLPQRLLRGEKIMVD